MLIKEEDLRKAVRDSIIKEISQGRMSKIKYASGLYRKYSKKGEAGEGGVFDGLETGLVSIDGGVFTLKTADDQILTFQSVPYQTAAAKAERMYSTVGGASDKGTEEEKDLIFNTVYVPASKTLQQKNIDRMDINHKRSYRKRLGTSAESKWSSWFFTAAYNEDPDYQPKSYPGYPAATAYRKRVKVLANPKSYQGKTFYMTFHRSEAPIFPGDGIFHWRKDKKQDTSGYSFYDIGGGGPAHMKIYVGGGKFIGGNEGREGTVKKRSMKVDSDGILGPGQGSPEYFAVYKKVKLLSPEEALTADRNLSTTLNIEDETIADGTETIEGGSSLEAISAVSEDGVEYLGFETINGIIYSKYKIPKFGNNTEREVGVYSEDNFVVVYDLEDLNSGQEPYDEIKEEDLGVDIKDFQDFIALTYMADIDDENIFKQDTRTV